METILHQLVAELHSGRVRVVDLTKPLGAETPVISLPPQFADAPAFRLENLCRYDQKGPNWYWNVLHVGEHTGTHFDAPIHWKTGSELAENACDTIPPRQFLGAAVVIDSTQEVEKCADYLLSAESVLGWERQYKRVPAGSWVLMRTGWSKRVGKLGFLNMDESGAHSPGFHYDAVRFLIEQRNVLGIGVETVGIDPGQADRFDPPFPNHSIVLGAGRYGLASLSNLEELPPTGSIVIAAPLKIIGGSGSPARVLALVTNDGDIA